MTLLGMNTTELTADEAIGMRVEMLMVVRRTNQTVVASAMGLTQSTLSKKLKGKTGWSTDDLLAVAHTLQTTIAYLFGEVEDPRPTDEARWSPLSDSNRRPPLYIVGGSVRTSIFSSYAESD